MKDEQYTLRGTRAAAAQDAVGFTRAGGPIGYEQSTSNVPTIRCEIPPVLMATAPRHQKQTTGPLLWGR